MTAGCWMAKKTISIIAPCYNEEDKNNIIFQMNDSLMKRDIVKYKSLINTLRQYTSKTLYK